MTRNEAVAHILGSGGNFFTVEFVRRTTSENGAAGDLRRMNARRGVRKYLRGGERAYNFEEKGVIGCWETPQSDPQGVGGYKVFPVDGLTRIKVDGRWVEVSD